MLNDVRKTFTIKHTQSFKEAFVATLQRKELSSSFNALDGISLEVPEGQSIALLGRNGSGKSTTLKLVSGVMRPDAGWIRTRGRIAGLLEVGAGFNPNLTGRDNVYLNAAILGMSKDETEARFNDILEFSEIGDFIDTEVKHYSSGMYSRLGFSVAVHTELDVLLVDEILSVGDAAFRAKCAERMQLLREQGKTMFVVSHSAGQVKQLCERGVVLQRGQIVFDGPIDEAVAYMEPPKKQAAPSSPPVEGRIKAVYEQNPKRYGKPLGPARMVTSNGGGTWQEFELGIITSGDALPPEVQTVGLTRGIFAAAYLRAGGPDGSWGFMAGPPQGIIEKFEARSMLFQNGIASYSIDHGLSFTPHVSNDKASGI